MGWAPWVLETVFMPDGTSINFSPAAEKETKHWELLLFAQ
jgi:hypothetical protein